MDRKIDRKRGRENENRDEAKGVEKAGSFPRSLSKSSGDGV